MGPHNTQLHRISTVNDAFSGRYDMMVNAIKNTLIPKRTQLIAQITRVDYRIEEIKTVKGIIDRDIKNEYGGVIERLNSAEGVKLAILQHDIAEVQKDVNRIDEILQHLDELNGSAPVSVFPAPQMPEAQQPIGAQGMNMIGFLSKYKKLQEDVDYCITKQFKVDISVIPNDLPRELAEKRVKLEEHNKQKDLLKQKNDIILKLVEEKKVREHTIKDELDKQTRREITQWVNLVDNYAEELKKFQLVCTFCGVHLDHIAVNLDCPKNPLIGDAREFVPPVHFYASIVPPKEFFATGRHFFVKPDDEEEDSDPNDTKIVLNEDALHENQYAASAVDKIRSLYSPERALEFEEKLRQLSIEAADREGRDPDESGVINRKDFEFLLKSEFNITGREVQNLLELITPSLDDKINVKNFFKFLKKPVSYEDSFRREDRNKRQHENIEDVFENTLKRDDEDGLNFLRSEIKRENILQTFPTKLRPSDVEYFKSAIEYQNAKNGLDGYIPYDDAMLIFTKSNIDCTNREIKEFLDSIPREGKRITEFSGVREAQFDVDYMKNLFGLL